MKYFYFPEMNFVFWHERNKHFDTAETRKSKWFCEASSRENGSEIDKFPGKDVIPTNPWFLMENHARESFQPCAENRWDQHLPGSPEQYQGRQSAFIFIVIKLLFYFLYYYIIKGRDGLDSPPTHEDWCWTLSPCMRHRCPTAAGFVPLHVPLFLSSSSRSHRVKPRASHWIKFSYFYLVNFQEVVCLVFLVENPNHCILKGWGFAENRQTL